MTQYEDIARDAMDGRRVVAFFDTDSQLRLLKNGIAAAAKRLGARKVVCPLRARRLVIDGNSVGLCAANGLDSRGRKADVVYLSDSAREQFDFAALVGATVK